MTHSSSAPVKPSEEPEPVSLRFRFDSETVEQFAERYASDVSRGGIFVHSRQPFAVGTQLRLDLQLLDGSPLIIGDGTVFWTREPDPNKPATVPGMGIRFSKLSGRSQQVIELVLSQRTGRERSGLFPTLSPSVPVEETGRILAPSPNPKSKLPFNVFPGRPNNTGSMPAARSNDGRELLANAGREESTPLVGVSAATMADARPGLNEPPSRVPAAAAAAPTAEIGNAPSGGSGVHKRPPLSLIKPGTPGAEKNASETSGPHRKLTSSGTPPSAARRAASGAHAIPTLTSNQEVKVTASSASHPPAPVQGEPAPGASHSGVPRPIEDLRSSAITPVPSLRPPVYKKMILGGAALLAAGLMIFLTARRSTTTIAPEVKPIVTASASANATATTTTKSPATAAANLPSAPTPTGGESAGASVAEGNTAPSLEPGGSSASAGGKSSPSSRGNDRRSSKGKPTVAPHRAPEPTVTGRTAPTIEKLPVVEPPRAEMPAPTPPPAQPPAPALVARAEAPAAPKAISTTPPPSAATAHKLRLTSIPSEAEVELDGRVIGRTPLFGVEIDVARPHALVVRKDGFAPFKQTVSSSSEWNVSPSENSATLRIQALLKK
jgi:uncharacterized protein (TIGR02266 family)